MSRCTECGSKGECQEWCGMSLSDLYEERKELVQSLDLALEAVDYYRRNCLVYEKTGIFIGGEFAASEEWGFMVTNKKAVETINKLKERGVDMEKIGEIRKKIEALEKVTGQGSNHHKWVDLSEFAMRYQPNPRFEKYQKEILKKKSGYDRIIIKPGIRSSQFMREEMLKDQYLNAIETQVGTVIRESRAALKRLSNEFLERGSRKLTAEEKVLIAIAAGVAPKWDLFGGKVLVKIDVPFSVEWTPSGFIVNALEENK